MWSRPLASQAPRDEDFSLIHACVDAQKYRIGL